MTLAEFVLGARQYLTEDTSACIQTYWVDDVSPFRPVPTNKGAYESMPAEIDAFSSSFPK